MSSKKTEDFHETSLHRLEERHRILLSKLAGIGLVLRGTIAPRMMRCGRSACRCQTKPPELHGPYFIWTRKVAGKTVTAMLSKEQAALCRPWSANMRNLDRIVRELQTIGLRAAATVRRRG